MPCYSPLKGWRARKVNKETGKRGIVFKQEQGFIDLPVELPCGQCIGCRLEKQRQWAVRIVHEALLWEENMFITCTYNDENLPESRSLQHTKDFVPFMKRLRRYVGYNYNKLIGFFMCGEYGEELGRPHYHAIIFNHWMKDAKPKRGSNLFLSDKLDQLWQKGYTSIGEVNSVTAAYVAKYTTKRITGDKSAQHYTYTDPNSGKNYRRCMEYSKQSTNPAIGKRHLEINKERLLAFDTVIAQEKEQKPPIYYHKLIERSDPERAEELRRERRREMERLKKDPEYQTERLRTKERVAKARSELKSTKL